MLVYFAASTREISKLTEEYQSIVSAIKLSGHKIIKNWFIAKLLREKIYKNPKEAIKKEIRLLTESDLVVVESSIPSIGVGYLVKQAIDQRKPILCLYLDKLDHSLISDIFLGNSSNLLKIEFYDNKNINEIINKNLSISRWKNLIKFNFLITPEISAYLDWVTSKTKLSRSEFLRDEIINKIIGQDDEYINQKK